MKKRLSLLSISLLILAISGYSQDSLRTKNDKPGTPQSLRSGDKTPQNHVEITNNNASPNQTDIKRPSESNNTNNTTHQVITVNPNNTVKPNPVAPNTISTTSPANMRTTTNSSAIQNGISNTSKPLRNQ